MRKTSQDKSGRAVIAITLIVIGIMALMGIQLLWPLVVLVPGLAILAVALIGGRATAPFAIPGTLVTGTGALLFVQNLTGYWESWSYAWTLYGVFLGIGFVMMGRLIDHGNIEKVGRGFITFSLIAFVGFLFLMEIVIGVGDGLGLWPLLLIGFGIYFVIQTVGSAKSRRSDKKRKDKLFSGPVVYGSRKTRDTSRLSVPEREDTSAEPD